MNSTMTGPVVTLSVDHEYATVYDRHRVEANDPADLVRAIQGVGKRHIPGPDQLHPKASMLFQPESGRNGDEGRSGKKSQVRRTRKEDSKQTETISRTTRARKGG